MSKFTKKFGFIFPEVIEVGRKRKNTPGWEELQNAHDWGNKALSLSGKKEFVLSSWRKAFLYFLFVTPIIILVARAFDLQIIQGRIFLSQAEGNRIRLQVEHAPRGVIFDRNGVILAQNTPGYRLLADSKVLTKENHQEVILKLAQILEVPSVDLEEKLRSAAGSEITLVSDLDRNKALLIETESKNLPGIELEISPVRNYPYKEITSHLLGFTAEADKADLERKLAVPYNLGDKIGKAGIEETMEEILRGINGYHLVKVTATGEKKGEIYQNNSQPGRNVTLSIDMELQKFVYETLSVKAKEVGVKAASAVVLDPASGEILALVSIPSYDNNVFAKGLTEAEYQNLVNNPDKLLLNRSIGASYPPGSTFKLITGSAGLELGVIKPETKLVDPGFINLGGRIFQNWLWMESKKTEGSQNIVRAIVRSTDTFFYLVGQMVGEKKLAEYAKLFGLGEKTQVEISGEVAGLVPTNKWKLATKGESWYPGETLNMSIGQGDVLATPIQMARVAAVFANGGKLVTPTILKTDRSKIVRKDFLKKETLDTIRQGMFESTYGEKIAGRFNYAGKTGTAESGSEEPHSWYTSFAPYPEAKIVVTVMMEYGGHGLVVCTPVAKKIFEWYFRTK